MRHLVSLHTAARVPRPRAPTRKLTEATAFRSTESRRRRQGRPQPLSLCGDELLIKSVRHV